MTAPTIAAELRQLLRAWLPFSAMAADELEFLLQHVELDYFEPGQVVLAPGDSAPEFFYIVKQGRVEGRVDNAETEQAPAYEAGAGDCFPAGALLAQRPVALTYRAAADTFCLLLPRARFEQLTQRSPAFLNFCTRRLGAMLDRSRHELQQSYSSEASAEHTMGMALRDLLRGAALVCAPDTELRVALERMQGAQVGSIVIVDGDAGGGSDAGAQRVVGILTRTDLIGRVILPQVSLSCPVQTVMTTAVRTLECDDTAADAMLLMAEQSIRHVPVIERRGGSARVAGVVSERDLFALQRLTLRQLSAGLRAADDVAELAALAADVRRLSHHLVAQGVASAQLTRLISHLNDQLTDRLLALGCARFGIAPDAFCWLAFGSEGRSEQTIATDQDNGILFIQGTITQERMLELADWVNQGLAQCGFPLCKGNIMARNPAWCLSAQEWSAQFNGWIDRGDPQALLNASIFFDFRPLYGAVAIAREVYAGVLQRAQHNLRFLKQMADNSLRNRPPSSGRFAELFGNGASGGIDLKLHGTVPFVDGARIWALAAGLAEVNTAERLRQLAAAGRLPAPDAQAWIATFEHFQLMRLRCQHRRAQRPAGAAVDAEGAADNPNWVAWADLSALDRRIAEEAFRQARKLQQRLELDFPG